MSTSPTPVFTTVPAPRPRPLRLGFLSLTDAAPFVAAQELGLFERHGIQVELRREIGWATIREKIIYGELEAAQAPAPMLWSAQLGLGCPPCEVLTALVLNLHGNAITLSRHCGTPASATPRPCANTPAPAAPASRSRSAWCFPSRRIISCCATGSEPPDSNPSAT
jgi:ABC-type nitrate/sulfonate/bicarbonate transport system substrate-binding protein